MTRHIQLDVILLQLYSNWIFLKFFGLHGDIPIDEIVLSLGCLAASLQSEDELRRREE